MRPRFFVALFLFTHSRSAEGVSCTEPSLSDGDWYVMPKDAPLQVQAFPVGLTLQLVCGHLPPPVQGGERREIVCQPDGTWLPEPRSLCATSQLQTTTAASSRALERENSFVLGSTVERAMLMGPKGCSLRDVPTEPGEDVVHSSAGTLLHHDGDPHVPDNDFVKIECGHLVLKQTVAWCTNGRWERVDETLHCPMSASEITPLEEREAEGRGCPMPLTVYEEGLFSRLERPGCGGRECLLLPDTGLVRPGVQVVFTCSERSGNLVGPRKAYCKRSGTWSNDGFWPRCGPPTSPRCRAPGHPENGWDSEARPGGGGEDFATGDRVNFYCAPGYRRRGPATLLCLPDGSWDQPLPLCIQSDEREYKEMLGLIMVGALLLLLLLLLVLSLVHRRLLKSRLSASRRSILTQVDASRSRAEEVLAARRESDRLALLALADGAGLPSYDDAVSAPTSPRHSSPETPEPPQELSTASRRRPSISIISSYTSWAGELRGLRSLLSRQSSSSRSNNAQTNALTPQTRQPSPTPPNVITKELEVAAMASLLS